MKGKRDDSGVIETLATCRIPSAVAPIIALLFLLFHPPVFGQLLREPQSPYHFLRYEDVPADQQSPVWPHDFWAPIKFIPLDILPGSYINFGGELRERVEHFSNPFFGLTPQGDTTYDLHRLLLNADLHIGDIFRTFAQFGSHLVSSKSLSPPTDVDQFRPAAGICRREDPDRSECERDHERWPPGDQVRPAGRRAGEPEHPPELRWRTSLL